MQAIRRKIWWVIILLIAAMAVSTVIYSNGGFSLTGYDAPGFCGTQNPSEPRLTGSASEGKVLFQANCACCHSMDKILTGPALTGSVDRAPSKSFIEDILLHPKETVRKYPYAKTLSKKYGDDMHMSFAGILTKKDITNLEIYLTGCSLPVPSMP